MGSLRPVSTVDEALAGMREIEAELPLKDGVAWFNKLYLRVTEEVQVDLESGGYQHPTFLGRLVVVFANLYFSRLRGR